MQILVLYTWWCHDIETLPASLSLCEGNHKAFCFLWCQPEQIIDKQSKSRWIEMSWCSFETTIIMNRFMTTSPNEHIFCVTGHMCGEFTGHYNVTVIYNRYITFRILIFFLLLSSISELCFLTPNKKLQSFPNGIAFVYFCILFAQISDCLLWRVELLWCLGFTSVPKWYTDIQDDKIILYKAGCHIVYCRWWIY